MSSNWGQEQLQDWEVDTTANEDIDIEMHVFVDWVSKAPSKVDKWQCRSQAHLLCRPAR